MRQPRRIITDNATFWGQYHDLDADDVMACRLSLKSSDEFLLVDLLERGVRLFPSATAQMASRSKVFQTALLCPFMVPHTMVIRDHHDIVSGINLYAQQGIGQVVTKHDRRNAGMGIHLWNSIEEVNTMASCRGMSFPFVVQPYVPACRDIRAVFLGDYEEAYWRDNPYSFRNNLHCGGKSTPCDLTLEQRALCRRIMARGKFPYGHIDLMVTAEGKTYFAEINLRGGIKGARIKPEEYQRRVRTIHAAYCSTLESNPE